MKNIIAMAATKVTEAAGAEPVKATILGLSLNIVAVLQSAQSVASTLTALFTSVAGCIVAYIGLKKAWKNRNKD